MNLVTEVRRVSLAQRLISTNGRPSGFDYLRLIFSQLHIAGVLLLVLPGSPSYTDSIW
jgi:hypothetical protein